MPLMENMGRGAGWAGRHAARLGNASARWARHRGGEMWDRVPRDEIREHLEEYRETLGDYLGRAREAIDDAVASELDDLRKAVRRQRKRLGV
jgi:FMN phosphatase YigB (HAD superfamily)